MLSLRFGITFKSTQRLCRNPGVDFALEPARFAANLARAWERALAHPGPERGIRERNALQHLRLRQQARHLFVLLVLFQLFGEGVRRRLRLAVLRLNLVWCGLRLRLRPGLFGLKRRRLA